MTETDDQKPMRQFVFQVVSDNSTAVTHILLLMVPTEGVEPTHSYEY